MGFGDLQTKFDVLFSRPRCNMIVKPESTDFRVTSMLVHESLKKKVAIDIQQTIWKHTE